MWSIKAQIHAGGRGEAGGGDKMVKSVEDVQREAQRLLGATLVTHQTGPKGKQVNRLYVEEGSAIDREFYLSALVDRETSRVAFVVSTEGGMDIEEVAHKTPEKIVTFSVDPAAGMMPHHGRQVARALGLTGDLAKQAEGVVAEAVCRLRRQGHVAARDQPAGLQSGQLICLDAKVGFDDNALYRHSDIVALRDLEEDPKEIEASKFDLGSLLRSTAFPRLHGQRRRPLHGDHGHHQAFYGEAPAPNFLDVGEQRHTRTRSRRRSRSITSDQHVEGHSGQHLRRHHAKTNIIAEGVVAAVKDAGLPVPLVVRLEGTNVEHSARRSSPCSKLNAQIADDLDDAAQKIVKADQGGRLMSVLIDKSTKVICQGLPARTALSIRRRRSPLPRRAHRMKGWAACRPAKGRRDHLNLPVLDNVSHGLAIDQSNSQRRRDLRAAGGHIQRCRSGDRAEIPLVVCATQGGQCRHGRRSSARCPKDRNRAADRDRAARA